MTHPFQFHSCSHHWTPFLDIKIRSDTRKNKKSNLLLPQTFRDGDDRDCSSTSSTSNKFDAHALEMSQRFILCLEYCGRIRYPPNIYERGGGYAKDMSTRFSCSSKDRRKNFVGKLLRRLAKTQERCQHGQMIVRLTGVQCPSQFRGHRAILPSHPHEASPSRPRKITE